MGIQFGSFDDICQTAALVICPLIGSSQGIEPSCYSRNVEIGGTLIFQPCRLLRCPVALHFHGPLTLMHSLYSDMFRTHCGNLHDGYHDISYP